MVARVLTIAVVLLASHPASAWKGEVTQVYDGDYISARYGRGYANVRLEGIAAPARGQPYSRRSRALTRKLVGDKTIRVLPNGESDRNARIIARVFVGQLCVNHELVRAGLAWWDRKNAPDDKKLARLEAAARKARRGLWSAADPVPPWEWRQGKRSARASGSASGEPARRDRVCKTHADCVLVKRRACGCPVCKRGDAWSVNREAARRWNRRLRRVRCPDARCAKCRRKIKATCREGLCVVGP